MAWTLEISKPAKKQLANLGLDGQKRILKFLYERVAVLDDPRGIGQALKGKKYSGLWKYRIGDYRIIRNIQDH